MLEVLYMTKIILIRHGQSIGNLERRYLGHTDLDLSPLGYAQAEEAAKYWKDEMIHAIYSSDLLRAHHTGEAHEKYHNLKVIPCKELREINIGDWEGVPIEVLKTEHYEDFVLSWTNNFGLCQVPGGESVLGAGTRFMNRVRLIAENHPGETVLITAHAAVIRAFWCIISEMPQNTWQDQPFPLNASSTIVYFDGEKFIPDSFSISDYMS